MSYLPQLRNEVVRAARRQVEMAPSSRRLRLTFPWRRPMGRVWSGIGLAASIAIVVAVVLIVLGARGNAPAVAPTGSGPHLPRLTASEQRRAYRIVNRIMEPVPQNCQHHPRRHPSISRGSPDSAMLTTLGVLRRKATPADTLDALTKFPMLNTAHGIYVRYVRLARIYRGTHYYLVPAANTGAPSEHCVAIDVQRLKAELPRIPHQLRAAVRQIVRRNVVESGPHEGVMFFSVGRDSGGASSGATINDIRRCGADLGGYGGPEDRPLSGIIPDGVASVTVTFAHQPGSPVSITGRPVANALVLPVPAGNLGPLTSMVWRSSSGRVIRTVTDFGACD